MQDGESGIFNIHDLHNAGINALNLFCSIFCMPVEMILRPFYGTRYFPPAVIFRSTMWVFFMPIFLMGISMIPFVGGQPPPGMFDISSFAKLFFLLLFAHSIRTYVRMVHVEKEEFSWYEGQPLPFIPLIPGSASFWRTRILIEPAFVFVTATVLGSFYIFQSSLMHYLQFVAFALGMKQFTHWYKSWEIRRDLLDAQNLGPLISRFAEDKATKEDLTVIHLASFPKNAPPEIRNAMEMAKGGETHAAQ
jgi:hypothetical protein